MKLFNIHLRVFLRDRFVLLSLILSLFFNLLISLLLFVKIPHSVDELVVLHYNIYFSIDLIGVWWRIFLVPLAGLAILFINFLLSYIIYKQNRVISYFLTGGVVMTHLLLLIASLTLIYINL